MTLSPTAIAQIRSAHREGQSVEQIAAKHHIGQHEVIAVLRSKHKRNSGMVDAAGIDVRAAHIKIMQNNLANGRNLWDGIPARPTERELAHEALG